MLNASRIEKTASYYRARYYDASTARFLSEDPVGFLGGINKYDYVFNDPVDWLDNRGTQAMCACPDPNDIHEQLEEIKDEMVENIVLPVKGAVTGGVDGFIIGCVTTFEVGCVEGGLPVAAVGALGGLRRCRGNLQEYQTSTKSQKAHKEYSARVSACELNKRLES